MISKIILWGMILALDLLISFSGKSQEHEHGVNDIPDWYDSDCCNKQDCRPVEDKTVNFGEDTLLNPMAIYTRNEGKLIYYKDRWRKSKDERYHACFRGETVYCIYIPIGV